MAGFLYYVPGREKISRPELVELGLGYAFDREAEPMARGVTGGPDGGRGVIVGRPGQFSAEPLGWYPARQDWRRIPSAIIKRVVGASPGLAGDPGPITPGKHVEAKTEPAPASGELWLGFYRESRPGPADLIRPDALIGHAVELADGRQWVIPVARAHAETDDGLGFYRCELPCSLALDAAGEWQRQTVVARYAELWAIAERWWEELLGHVAGTDTAKAADSDQVQVSFDFADGVSAAVVCLGTNYRIGPVEVAALEILTDQAVGRILNALVDWPTWLGWLEKKTAAGLEVMGAGSRFDDGRPAGIDHTGPQ